MEPPATLDREAVRDEKVKVLESLRPMAGPAAIRQTVRGQYGSGRLGDEAVPGYLAELDRPARRTETFVALQAEVDNWRWAGVPFYLRSGKRLAAPGSEIVVQFREVPHAVFPGGRVVTPNRLVLRLQPDEGMRLHLMAKGPGRATSGCTRRR